MAAHQQAGDFQVVVQGGQIVQKNGGNVASYFCTPEGRVVNAVLGPVGADELLREANWATDAYEAMKSASTAEGAAKLAASHLQASRQLRGQPQQIHRLLAQRPLAALDEIYQTAFQLLGEGERAKGLQSPQVQELRADNDRTRRETERLAQRLNGTGSAAELRLREENERLKDERDRLREIDNQRRQEEATAMNWLRSASDYLASGLKKDEEMAIARLRLIIERYPDTKAADKAADLLGRAAGRARSSVAEAR